MENNLPEEIKKVVEPYLPMLHQWVTNGIQSYIENDSMRNGIFENRTKCGMVRDYIMHEVIVGSDGNDNIQITKRRNLFLFIIEQKYAIKIKKLNNNKMSVGHPTNQMELFRTGQMEIPGLLEKPKCLEIGYIPDSFWLGSRGIYLTCRSEKWYCELEGVPQEKIETKPQKARKKRVKIKEETNVININVAK